MESGKEYIIHVKSVALATDGFGGSGEMEEKHLENTYFPFKGEWKLFGMHHNNGKMLEAAAENGAGTYDISAAPWFKRAASTDSSQALRRSCCG